MTESSYKKPTLDEFIKRARDSKTRSMFNSAALVIEPGFEFLYVRYGSRYILLQTADLSSPLFNTSLINPPQYDNVLDLANLTVKEDLRGRGTFTKLVFRLRKNYPDLHLFVENALEDRFRRHLLKIGFSETLYDSFFMKAKE